MKGVLLALSTVIVWAILNVVNRFCVLQYDVNIMVFTSFMIFATGVTLMIIRKQVMPQNWKSGVKYSWLYTIMHPQFHDDLYLPLYHFDRDQSSVQHRDYNHLHSGLCHFSKNTL